jgi:hypothetical protein
VALSFHFVTIIPPLISSFLSIIKASGGSYISEGDIDLG